MLYNTTFLRMLFENVLIIIVWHGLAFILCKILPEKIFFSPQRYVYKAKKWEKNGKWYKKYLKINTWKDLVPQFVSDGGFSKKNMNMSFTPEYIDRFIIETCRGEWMHTMGFLSIIVVCIINTPLVAFSISIPLIFGTLPFVVIQRYNRFRLQILEKKFVRSKN